MIPEIRDYHETKVLFVKGVPFYAVAGEVHNSDSSSPEYMEKIWKKAEGLGMNTLLLPITWELLEPEEGTFDFSVPDCLIRQARDHEKKIIFLWFGSWKNAEMMYAPSWVKKDRKRFRRAQIVKGEDKTWRKTQGGKTPYYSLSYLCEETKRADANAFARLMRHIREIDAADSTVIAIQVENETGLLGNAREVSEEADHIFGQAVPQEFAQYMKVHTDTMCPDVKEAVRSGADQGTWREVFGKAAEEIFSAYWISKFVNAVAQQGKAEYPLPMLVNCWLAHNGERPGDYPSGGPVSRMHEVWHYGAPSIDVFAPDIYVPQFMEVCEDYSKNGAPLCVPETATHSYAASRLAYCIGHYHAMCYAPFGFDDIGKPFTAAQGFLFGVDVGDPALKIPQNYEEYAWFGKTFTSMMALIADKYGTADLQAVCGERKNGDKTLDFKNIRIEVLFQSEFVQMPEDGVMVGVKAAENEIYLIGYHCTCLFTAGDAKNLDILELEEGKFIDGKWKKGRRLNGDEAAVIIFYEPRLLHLKYHTYDDEYSKYYGQ